MELQQLSLYTKNQLIDICVSLKITYSKSLTKFQLISLIEQNYKDNIPVTKKEEIVQRDIVIEKPIVISFIACACKHRLDSANINFLNKKFSELDLKTEEDWLKIFIKEKLL